MDELAKTNYEWIENKFDLVNKDDEGDIIFYYGIAIVKLNNKYGFINEQGKLIGKGCIYDYVDFFKKRFYISWDK